MKWEKEQWINNTVYDTLYRNTMSLQTNNVTKNLNPFIFLLEFNPYHPKDQPKIVKHPSKMNTAKIVEDMVLL